MAKKKAADDLGAGRSRDRVEEAKRAIRDSYDSESDERALEILDDLAAECEVLADGIRDDMKNKEDDE